MQPIPKIYFYLLHEKLQLPSAYAGRPLRNKGVGLTRHSQPKTTVSPAQKKAKINNETTMNKALLKVLELNLFRIN